PDGGEDAALIDAVTVAYRVSGTVFGDTNLNGRQDPGEPSLPGYVVEVIGGNRHQITTSGPDTNPGGYSFDNVANGSCLNVRLPSNAKLTTPVGSDLQFAAAQELSAFGIDIPASADFRAANLQGNQAVPDLIVNTGDTVYVRQTLADGTTRIL